MLMLKLAILLLAVVAVSYGGHPCQDARPNGCDGAAPMVCQYDITLEWYLTLSKACFDCPFNPEDCNRQDCIPGDGNRRPVISMNRQMPGPLVEVCEGDTIKFKVRNLLTNAESTTIHFHGLHQKGTPHMDGTAFVTQCPIGIKSAWTYEFTADPSGTHLYHSHSGLQMADGLLGPAIIHPLVDNHANRYDHDCHSAANPMGYCHHVIAAHDWHTETYVTAWAHSHHNEHHIDDMVSSLINGRNSRFPVCRTVDGVEECAYIPHTRYDVVPGKRYRFRIMKEGHMTCPFKFSVDSHKMKIISADGHDTKPLVVDSILAYSGERYDFVLTAGQTPGNYWIKAHALQNCRGANANAYAVLHYTHDDNGDPVPFADPTEDRDADRVGHLLQPIVGSTHGPEGPDMTQTTAPSELEFHTNDDQTQVQNEVVDKTVYLVLDMMKNDNSRFHVRDRGYGFNDVSPSQQVETPTINNITFMFPAFNAISQLPDVPPAVLGAVLCNADTLEAAGADCGNDLCVCIHYEGFALNDIVEFIMINHDHLPHPFHMHGYAYKVMGEGTLGELATKANDPRLGDHDVDTGTVRKLIKQHNENDPDFLNRNYKNPSRRDTYTIHGESYVVVRLYADNPGYWVYHCHTTEHIEGSQIFLFQVGARSEMAKITEIEANMPKCGSFEWPNANQIDVVGKFT